MSTYTGVLDLAVIDDYVLVLTTDGQWAYTIDPPSIDQPIWYEMVLPEGASNLRYAGRVPLLVDDRWVSAGLLNSATASTPAIAVYRDPVTGLVEHVEWADRYPEGDPGTDAMPKANICSNWGDFTLLGDIVWKRDPGEAFSSGNQLRYPHGIWFSEPGISDAWNPINTLFVGQRQSDNAILAMFPVDAGLVIVTQSLIALLRGEPNDFVYEELREGISPQSRDEVAFWPYTGLVVWMDVRGRVWATNGDVFERLDRNITIERTGPGAVHALDENLFVSGRKDVRVLRSFGEGGAWTRMVTPTGWRKAVSSNALVIGIGADQDTGLFILDSSSDGRLDLSTLAGPPDLMQVYDLEDEERRGTFEGKPVVSLLRSRPLPGSSDRTVFWHRFGIRCNGGGALVRTASYDGPTTESESLEAYGYAVFDERKDQSFPAHGPSMEAVFEFEFEGDVTPEHVTVAYHQGRSER